MSIRSDFKQPATYLDVKKVRREGHDARLDNLRGELLEHDLAHFLNIKDATEMGIFAARYAFFDASPQSEIAFDTDSSLNENLLFLASQIGTIAVGYLDMQRHMNKAIELKKLSEESKLRINDLDRVGIEISPASDSDRMAARFFKETTLDTMGYTHTSAGPVLDDCWALQHRLTLPVFSCRDYVTNSNSPYGRHVRSGIDQVNQRGSNELKLIDSGNGFCFDFINDHYPDNADGYHQAVLSALDNLISINLANVATVARAGAMEQKCLTVYAAFWYEFALWLERGRALRCEACGKPLIALNERGMKRRYCDATCRKRAQRIRKKISEIVE